MNKSDAYSNRDYFIAEFIGTFVLVFFGLGAVCSAVAFDSAAAIWQIAIVWGVAIMLAIYSVGGISGAHINPAITLAMYVWDGFEREKVGVYILGQFCGAGVAALVLFFLFSAKLQDVEASKGVVRGQPGSEITASCFGEFYPSPGGLTSDTYSPEEHAELRKTVPHSVAFLAEVLGTGILAFMVLAVTDASNKKSPQSGFEAVFIGLTVSILICVIAPLTQACFNPARDFAPRLVAAMAGWGQIALPLGKDWGWLTVYIVAPSLGAVCGGGCYKKIVAPLWNRNDAE